MDDVISVFSAAEEIKYKPKVLYVLTVSYLYNPVSQKASPK